MLTLALRVVHTNPHVQNSNNNNCSNNNDNDSKYQKTKEKSINTQMRSPVPTPCWRAIPVPPDQDPPKSQRQQLFGRDARHLS